MTVLRPMRWWDVEAVAAMERVLFEDPWSPETFWSELAQGTSRTYLVAEDGGQVVGYAGLAAFDDEGSVQTIGVAPPYQGKGIGALLLSSLLRDAAARGLDRVGLEVRVDNAAAQALYRRFGFAPVGLRRGYYQPSGADALVMVATGYAERLAR